jgi:Do/DeqQ family serine protease
MLKRLSIPLLCLTVGLLLGTAVSGTLRGDAAGQRFPLAATDAPESPSGTAPAALPAPPAESGAAQRAPAAPDFTGVAERVVPAVANISSIQIVRQRSPFFYDPFFDEFFGGAFGRERYASSLGSGVVVSSDGFVVTNNHVLGEGTIDRVTVSFADRREVEATIVGVDTWTDLALLKVEAGNLPVIPWGDSSQLKVAEWVMAIGNPYQLSQSVSLGIVSALGRSGMGITAYEDFIQTDAAINPGNSGGALVNARGELVGINTAIYTESGGYQGIGFAVPSNVARRVVNDLMRYGEVRRGSIGYMEVAPLTTIVARELGAPSTDGVVVLGLRRGPAWDAGIRQYDVILSFNGQRVTDPSSLLRYVSDAPIGSTATVEVLRDGKKLTLKVRVERQAARTRLRR